MLLVAIVLILLALQKYRAGEAGLLVLGARQPIDAPPFENQLFNPHVRDIAFDNPRYNALSHVSMT